MNGPSRSPLHRVSLLLNLLLAILCAFLIRQNHDLKSGGGSGAGIAALKPGDHVEGFSYRQLDGATHRLDYADARRAHLLFVLSTTCPFCQKSLPNIQELFDRHKTGACDLLAVSIHDLLLTAQFAAERKLGFPLVSAPDEQFSRNYKIGAVPTTILVRGDGVVDRVWEGELTRTLMQEIESSLSRPALAPFPS